MPHTQLFDSIAPWAAKAASNWCGRNGIDGRLRPDCVQEALIECWQATRRFDKKRGDLKPYCMCRMIGAIRDFLRREAPIGYRRKTKNVTVFRLTDGLDPQDHRCISSKRAADVREILDDISSKMSGQDHLILFYLRNGVTQAEIAKRMRMCEANVWKHVEQIKRRFAAKMMHTVQIDAIRHH